MRSKSALPWPAIFWARVDDSAGPDACWIWTGALGRDGYGLAYSKPLGRALMTAHRAAYLIGHPGEPHPPMVLHLCDTPLCCNPQHLVAGDQAANMADMKAKGRAGGGRLPGTPSFKITDELARVIAAEREAGSSVRSLATKYGLSAPGVRYVLKRVAEGRTLNRTAFGRKRPRRLPGTK